MLRFLIADKTLTSYENIPDQNLEFVDDNLAVLLKSLVCYVQVLHFKIHRIILLLGQIFGEISYVFYSFQNTLNKVFLRLINA